jgi:hypothetical protein
MQTVPDRSRRDLFRNVAGLSALGPIILRADNKSGSAKPILGEGDHNEVTHDGGELPANVKYGNTHGVCEDSQGYINDASESHDSIVVFDAKGRFVKSWGKEFQGGAHGLHIRKEGSQKFLYGPCYFSERHGEFVIPDLGARVTLMDRENKVITHLGDDSAANTWKDLRKQTRDHFIPGKFVWPHGACFDHKGNVFVVEWVEVGRVRKLRKVA